MEVQAFLLCDSVVQDAQTGKSFVHGIFDRIWTRSFPAVHQSCAAFFRIRFDDQGNHNVSLNLIAPSGLRQPTPSIPVTMGSTNVAQGTINIQGLPLPVEGRYEFELLVDQQRVARYMLDVIAIGEQSRGTTH
jgi:Family of unknown function (DUF6941)